MTTIHDAVRDQYGKVARQQSAGCCSPGCCSTPDPDATKTARALGYSEDELAAAPEGANLGLGCGNPQAIAALQPGQTVLDLGSGGGFDCFLAAREVGPSGQVIGVDMTPDMVSLARKNAAGADVDNVEFRLGEIEHLPVADDTVDVILSNCVVNLSPDKPAVFADAFRVLRSGGRLAISDVVARGPLPDDVRRDVDLLAGCVAGAATVDEVRTMIADAGFTDVSVTIDGARDEALAGWSSERSVADWIASARIEARKP
jgi:SAM-dependent methyltransferase